MRLIMNIFDSEIAEIEVSYSNRIPVKNRIKISGSQDVADSARLFWPGFDHVEYFYVLYLNRNNQILGTYLLSKGGFSGTAIDIRVIFQVALKVCANAIICLHNHPSGNIFPSDADKIVTRKIVQAGKIMDVQVLDHVILTSESYYSFADNGDI